MIAAPLDAASTLRRAAALRRLDGFALRPRGRERLEDTYFDTPDGRLGARRIALRIRRIVGPSSRTLLTLKGPGTRTRSGAASRDELELPLSRRAILRALAELRRMHVALPATPSAMRKPPDFPQALGLIPVQKRRTERTLIDVYAEERGTSHPVAEVAIDRVSYVFGNVPVRLLEVEIEAKGKGTPGTVSAIAGALRRRFPRALAPWAYSKLATGKALERAAHSGALARWTTSSGRLKPSALPHLSRRLARDR